MSDLLIRLSEEELDELDRALEFEGFGSGRDDLRDLMAERRAEAEAEGREA